MRLKPTFWKLSGHKQVHSGWLKPVEEQPEKFSELWVIPKTALTVACALVRHNPALTCKLVEEANRDRDDVTLRGVMTDIMSLPLADLSVELALFPGDRVLFARRLEMTPYTVIDEGEEGIVDYAENRNGGVDIRLQLYHRGLRDFDNMTWLIPGATDDWLSAIEILPKPPLPAMRDKV